MFNILGIGYGSALFLGFMNCNSLQPVVAMERVVFYREKASGMYSSMAFVIGQVSQLVKHLPSLGNATNTHNGSSCTGSS